MILLLILVGYTSLNFIRLLELWSADPQAIPRLSSAMVIAFATAKLLLTASFSIIVVMHCLVARRTLDATTAVPT